MIYGNTIQNLQTRLYNFKKNVHEKDILWMKNSETFRIKIDLI